MKHKKLIAILSASMVTACVFGLVGCAGQNGENGVDGLSAYEIAVNNGFTGTEQEWLAALKGAQGTQGEQGLQGEVGKSAYEVYRENTANPLPQDLWLASLKGEVGLSGRDGVYSITSLTYINEAPKGHEDWNDLFDKWKIQHHLQITYKIEGGGEQIKISDGSLNVVDKNTYYEASTSEEIWKLINFGVSKISCSANTQFNWVGNSIMKKGQDETSVIPVIRLRNDLEINLNGCTLTMDALFLSVENGATVTLRNGTIRRTERTTDIQQEVTDIKGTITYQSMNDLQYGVMPNQHAMEIAASSKLVLDTLEFYSKYDGIKIMGSSATLEVKSNSKVEVEGIHAISTESTNETRHNVIVNLSDSDIIVRNKTLNDADISYNESVEGQAILFNIPGRLNVDNCTVTGRTSAVVVRGGYTVISNSVLNTNTGYTDNTTTEENSGFGASWNNRLPNATVVVGNHSTNEAIKTHQYVADCTLVNTAINAHKDTRHAVFMYGNEGVGTGYNESGEWIGATLTFDAMTFARSGSEKFHISQGNAFVRTYRPEMLLNASTWYAAESQDQIEDLLLFGASKIRLTQDLILKETNTADLSQYTVFDSDVEIGLSGHTLTVDSQGIVIRNNANVKFTNGILAMNGGNGEDLSGSYAIEVDEFSHLELDAVKMYTNCSGILMNGSASSLEITAGSEIYVGGFYGIGTNVNGTKGYDTIITIRYSKIVAKGELELPSGSAYLPNNWQAAENKYGIAVSFNVPGVLQVEQSSYLAGYTQGIVLRNGAALIEDSQVAVLGTNSELDKYSTVTDGAHSAWGLGYNVPNAVVVVGTYHTVLNEGDDEYIYQDRAEVTLKNVELLRSGTQAYIYIHNDNNSEEPTIITFDKLTALKTLRASYAYEELLVTRCENDESNVEIWDERRDGLDYGNGDINPPIDDGDEELPTDEGGNDEGEPTD